MRPSNGHVGTEGVTTAASDKFMPARGSQAPAEPEEPSFPLGGKRTNSVTTPLPRNSQMISDSVQAVAKALAAKRIQSSRALGLSLAGGSGWAIVNYNLHEGDVRAYWAGNHKQTLAGGLPLLVMDMYERAYAIDYGAVAAKYVDAFFQNINWDSVSGRLEAAEKASALLRR